MFDADGAEGGAELIEGVGEERSGGRREGEAGAEAGEDRGRCEGRRALEEASYALMGCAGDERLMP